jgi:hypothetical protein
MHGLRRFIIQLAVLAIMLLGLPLLGVSLSGLPISKFLEFPPKTRYVQHAAFSWTAFALYTGFILAGIIPLIVRGVRNSSNPKHRLPQPRSFPWWGWLGILTGIASWILAWERFAWFAAFQPHTFSPLWFSFIVVINALCFRRTGTSLMTERPGFFLLLFPASATFWWFFEYLNRFVQNWYYVGPEFSAQEYFWYATLPFSTVLPAVLSTRQWLLSGLWIRQRYSTLRPFGWGQSRWVAAVTLVIAAAGLTAIGVWPNYFFPLLWISPLLILVGLQTLMKQQTIIDRMSNGDWSVAVASILAALVCGLFWEMWNYYSLAKWQYSIPFVHRFLIFEMPILGYAGYLPFGLECTVVEGVLAPLVGPEKS